MVFDKDIENISLEDLDKFFEEKHSEGKQLDYKSQLPDKKDLIKYAVCFSNNNGGYLIIGVDADKKFSRPTEKNGIDIEDGLRDKIIQMIRDNTRPPIIPNVSTKELSNSKSILIIEFDCGEMGEIYRTNDNKTYFRTGEQCVNIPEDIISKIKGDENDKERIQKYKESIKLIPDENLEKLDFLKDYIKCKLQIIPYYPYDNMIDTKNEEVRKSIRGILLKHRDVWSGNNIETVQDGFIIEFIKSDSKFILWDIKKRGIINHKFFIRVTNKEIPIFMSPEPKTISRKFISFDHLEEYLNNLSCIIKEIFEIIKYNKKIRIIFEMEETKDLYLDSSKRDFIDRKFRLPKFKLEEDFNIKDLIENHQILKDKIIDIMYETVGVRS